MEAVSRGFRIRYEVDGAGTPVLLLHGGAQWGELWADCGYVDGLRDRFQVITPDRLGHGRSDKPLDPAAHREVDIATDFCAVLDAVGARRAHVWGYSLGAKSAATLAVLHPERVRSVVLGGNSWPSFLDEYAQLQETFTPWMYALLRLDRPPWFNVTWTPRSASPLEMNDRLAVVASYDGARTFVADWRKIAAPTLFYCGDGDLTMPDDEKRLAGYEDALTYVLPACNHVAGFTRSDEVLAFVRPFLEGVESR